MLAGLGFGGSAARAAKVPVVVELFTSQGCSSCPAADAFMHDLVDRPGVLALSYHVDYWDYLGWKDTLGSAANSRRQYDYAKSRGDMDVYTPQMVISGAAHRVGSNRSAVNGEVAGAKDSSAVGVTLELDGDEIVTSVGADASGAEGTLWLLGVTAKIDVRIERGENAGKDVTYLNVVRKHEAVGMWKGKALDVRVPKASIDGNGAGFVVALLQQGHVGRILGTARLQLPRA